MNYIYDVLLNFQKNYYEFFEWNKKDHIDHMRKVPIIKVSKKQFLEIKNNIIELEKNFIDKLNMKAETFKKNNITKSPYIFIIGTEYDCIAIKTNKKNIVNYKSSLQPSEQEEILKLLKLQKEIHLNYTIIKKIPQNNFKTRFEIENKNLILKELTKIYKQNNTQKINYLYLECFNKQELNIDKAYTKLKNEIEKSNKNFKKLYNIFKIINQK